MNKKITLALAQLEAVAGNPEASLASAEKVLGPARAAGAELVCFPEMWATGFDWPYLAAHGPDLAQIVERMKEWARQHQVWIAGTWPAANARGALANASLLFSPAGEIAARYDKMHLFKPMGEGRHLAAGGGPVVFDAPWGRTAFATCYDIRFPELFRGYALRNVELVILPAAFPAVRIEHWQVLARARAIENQMFVAAINAVGREPDEHAQTTVYGGSTMMIDPLGRVMAQAGGQQSMTLVVTVDLAAVGEIRQQYPVLADRRPGLYAGEVL